MVCPSPYRDRPDAATGLRVAHRPLSLGALTSLSLEANLIGAKPVPTGTEGIYPHDSCRLDGFLEGGKVGAKVIAGPVQLAYYP